MDGFSEQLIQQKMSKTKYVFRIVALAVITIVIFLGAYVSMFPGLDWVVPLVLILFVVGIYLIYNLLKNSGIEYEYTCVGGEFRVDRIKGRKKRKVITRADIKSIEIMGKYSEMDKTKVDPSEYGIIYKAAINLDDEGTYYAIIHDKIKHRPALLYFTPDERTLAMMKPHLSVQLKKQLFLEKKSKSKD